MTTLIPFLFSLAALAAPEGKSLLLVEAESDGESLMAEELWVAPAKLTEADKKYLPQVCRWYYSLDGVVGGGRYYPDLKNPEEYVTPEQAKTLLADKAFTAWAGKELAAVLEEFEKGRHALRQFNLAYKQIQREKYPKSHWSLLPGQKESDVADATAVAEARPFVGGMITSTGPAHPGVQKAMASREKLMKILQKRWSVKSVDKSQLYE